MEAKSPAKVIAWSLYDLAAKFFTLNIVTLHFATWLAVEKEVPNIFYVLAYGLSLVFALFLSPFVGKISDITAKKREILAVFTLLCSGSIAFLSIAEHPAAALIIFAFANFSIQLAIIVYNALITSVASSGNLGFISGLGKMFGYIGAILILYLMTPIVENYGYYHLFLISGPLLFLFSLPCIIMVKEKKPKEVVGIKEAISLDRLAAILKSTMRSLKDLCRLSGVKDLLKAAFFALCPINVLILFMGVYLTEVFGLGEMARMNVIGVGTLAAIASSIGFGALGDRIGYKRTLYIVFGLMFFGFILVSLTTNPAHAFWLGVIFGAILGAILAVPRALAVALVPDKRIGEFFGFFMWMGFLAGLIGPIPWGVIDLLFSFLGPLRYRIAIVVSGLFIFPSLYYFRRVPEKRGGSNG